MIKSDEEYHEAMLKIDHLQELVRNYIAVHQDRMEKAGMITTFFSRKEAVRKDFEKQIKNRKRYGQF